MSQYNLFFCLTYWSWISVTRNQRSPNISTSHDAWLSSSFGLCWPFQTFSSLWHPHGLCPSNNPSTCVPRSCLTHSGFCPYVPSVWIKLSHVIHRNFPAYFSRLGWPIEFYLGASKIFLTLHAYLLSLLCSQYPPGGILLISLPAFAYFFKYSIYDYAGFLHLTLSSIKGLTLLYSYLSSQGPSAQFLTHNRYSLVQ